MNLKKIKKGGNSNAARKIQRKFRTYKKRPVLKKAECRKKFKHCINKTKKLNENHAFSSSNTSSNSDNNNSFYEKLANKYTRCKKKYKICRGYTAKSRTSEILENSPGFFNRN